VPKGGWQNEREGGGGLSGQWPPFFSQSAFSC